MFPRRSRSSAMRLRRRHHDKMLQREMVRVFIGNLRVSLREFMACDATRPSRPQELRESEPRRRRNRARGDLLQIIPPLNTVPRTLRWRNYWRGGRSRVSMYHKMRTNGRMISAIIDRLISMRYKATAHSCGFLSRIISRS